MKVVINSCHGGFNLSDEAIKLCLERGMRLTTLDKKGQYNDPTADFVVYKQQNPRDSRFHVVNKWNEEILHNDCNAFRSNPILIQVVEELGEKANGRYAKLKIIEIPFDGPEGWEVDEYDGSECIVEKHRKWY